MKIKHFVVTVGLLVGCRHSQVAPVAKPASSTPPAASAPPTVKAPPTATTPSLPKPRAISPATGTVTSELRPVLRVTPGTTAVEICRTRACSSPLKVAVGADGHATPPSDLERGVWFWRVAPAGPLWSIVIRPSVGHASRVRGFDVNGDGRADLVMGPGILYGATAVAELSKGISTVTLVPVGDIDGDGFDDAAVEGRVARGGPQGFRPEAEWVPCPRSTCGVPVGDIDGDGYADLAHDGTLQLGSPNGFREVEAPLLADAHRILRAGDLDGDGIADVMVLGMDQRTVSVVRGGHDRLTAGSKTMIPATMDAVVTLELGDIDGDGIADIVTSFKDRNRMRIRALSTLPGGDIAHGTERRFTAPANGDPPLATFEIADVDGDGFDDIVIFIGGLFSGHARLARGAPANVNLEARPIGVRVDADLSVTDLISVGDLNGDGRDDVVFKARQAAGFMDFFEIHVGSKTGLTTALFASYKMSEGDDFADRRIPRPTSED